MASDDPHVPPVGPVTTITSARIKTAKDDVDVLDLLPKLCGGVATFGIKPIYAQVREKKLLTTTEEEDKQVGFPAVQFFIEYADKEGGHTDSYRITDTVTLGEYTTTGRIYCAPNTMVYQLSVYAGLGALGFLAIILWVVGILYSWKIWDLNTKNFDNGLSPTDKRFSDVASFFARGASFVASPIFKLFMAIMAAIPTPATVFGTGFINALFYYFVISPGSKIASTATQAKEPSMLETIGNLRSGK